MRRQEDPLKSPNPLVRLEGLVSLTKGQGKLAAPALITAAGDPDERVRFKAIDLLGNLKVKEAVPAMVSNLTLTNSRAEKLRTIAALGRIGDAGATDPLLLFLKREDVDREMRASAIFALGGIGDAKAREALRKISLEDSDTELKKIAESSLQHLEK